MIYIANFANFNLYIHFFQHAWVRALLFLNICIIVADIYIDFVDLFLRNLKVQILHNIRINNYVNKKIDNQQIPYKSL